MNEISIMLVCQAGMSTSLLVKKMQDAADEQKMNHNIFAISSGEADGMLSTADIDVLLLGPQVRYLLNQYNKKLEKRNIPIDVINMANYGMMDGAAIFEQAKKLAEERKA